MLPLNSAILDRAVSLRQQRRMSLGDSLIAGTALAHGLTLLTHNVDDFRWITTCRCTIPLARGLRCGNDKV